ncbi:GNAT family N-acetyltransferase [Geotalea sp. SG265]|uniref:GNAT family N-acetyltransferase n=1 Tax=Geotalea sp. SG265 TaxID=2922867 RepID=UPI001FB03A72|nr:GNAT family N-acetyltransferase [Geotalea sp. SG265]
MQMIIGPAAVADAAEILALQRLAYRSEAELYDDFTIPPLAQSLDELVAEFHLRTVLKAVDGERIVGSVQGFQVGDTCFVGRLMVHPARQGRGLGTQLMAAIESRFTAVDRFELYTGDRSENNIRLYQRLGYRRFRVEDVNPHLSLFFMEKYRS